MSICFFVITDFSIKKSTLRLFHSYNNTRIKGFFTLLYIPATTLFYMKFMYSTNYAENNSMKTAIFLNAALTFTKFRLSFPQNIAFSIDNVVLLVGKDKGEHY